MLNAVRIYTKPDMLQLEYLQIGLPSHPHETNITSSKPLA